MKKILITFCLLISSALYATENIQSSSSSVTQDAVSNKQLFDIDKVVAIVDGPERKRYICKSELLRVGIDGKKPSLQELIIEELTFQDAVKHKIPVEDFADRYIATIKKSHAVNDREVDRIFEAAGLTSDEGRAKLQLMGAHNTMIDMKVKSRIFVPQQEVEEYYKNHPEYKEGKYQLEVAFMPFFSHDRQKQEEQYQFLVEQTKQGQLDVVWGSPFWLKENDIADDKKFITAMNIGDISLPQYNSTGFEFCRLVGKKDAKLIPLEKRFRVILDTLREPKFKEIYDNYINDLLAHASIIYPAECYSGIMTARV